MHRAPCVCMCVDSHKSSHSFFNRLGQFVCTKNYYPFNIDSDLIWLLAVAWKEQCQHCNWLHAILEVLIGCQSFFSSHEIINSTTIFQFWRKTEIFKKYALYARIQFHGRTDGKKCVPRLFECTRFSTHKKWFEQKKKLENECYHSNANIGKIISSDFLTRFAFVYYSMCRRSNFKRSFQFYIWKQIQWLYGNVPLCRKTKHCWTQLTKKYI